MAESGGYRFEPLVRRGLIFGFGPGQVAAVVLAGLGAVLIVRSWPSPGGLALAALAVVCAVAACKPFAGKSVFEWVRAGAAFGSSRRERAAGPMPGIARAAGELVGGNATPALRSAFAPGVHVADIASEAGEPAFGSVVDTLTGTMSVVLRARGDGFCLSDRGSQERRLAAWAAVLESVSSHRSALVRLQWCQCTVPEQAGAVVEHLQSRGDPRSPGFADQLSFLESAAQGCWRHETLLVGVVRCPLRRGRPSEMSAGALRAQVKALRSQLLGAGIMCDAALDAGSLYELVKGPTAMKEHWGALQLDGSWARTYWVAEWPRARVAPDFLSALLSGPGRRRFSVVYKPVPPEQAVRDAESSRTAEVADATLRAQGGFLETARQRRRSEALEGREAELADGRGAFEFCGYVTVEEASADALDRSCSDLERAAGASRIVLRALWGQQRAAYAWALPLGRGV